MQPKNKDTTANNLATLLERSLSQTQSLVKEAESIVARLAKNRAAISRPISTAPADVVMASQEIKTAPPLADIVATRDERSRDVNLARSASWKPNDLSDADFQGLAPILESRGFVVNSDMRRLFDLSVIKASARLRALVHSDYLLHEGMGTAARYFRGSKWPAARENGQQHQEQTQIPRLRLATTSDLIALAAFAATPDSVHLTSAPPAASLETGQGSLNAIAAELRSPFKLLMLAVDEESRIVGYVHTVIRRKVGQTPAGFIRALVLGAHQSPHLADRLLRAAINIMSDSQMGQLKVHVPAGDSRLRGLLEDSGFHVRSVEMTFIKTA